MPTVTYIDPPSGWKYGFPKVIPENQKSRVHQWLIEQGYPKEELDKMGEHFYCKWWEQEEKVDEQRL